jgi:hypothetical protein
MNDTRIKIVHGDLNQSSLQAGRSISEVGASGSVSSAVALSDGHLLTSAHGVDSYSKSGGLDEEKETYALLFDNNGKLISYSKAQVILPDKWNPSSDERVDLAVLKLDNPFQSNSLDTFKIADQSPDTELTVQNPLTEGKDSGDINVKVTEQQNDGRIAINNPGARMGEGASGSGITNQDGEIVAITESKELSTDQTIRGVDLRDPKNRNVLTQLLRDAGENLEGFLA